VGWHGGWGSMRVGEHGGRGAWGVGSMWVGEHGGGVAWGVGQHGGG